MKEAEKGVDADNEAFTTRLFAAKKSGKYPVEIELKPKFISRIAFTDCSSVTVSSDVEEVTIRTSPSASTLEMGMSIKVGITLVLV